MNAEEIRIKVAECLGWKLVPFDGKGRWLRNGVRTILYPPDFSNSLDACAEMIASLSPTLKTAMASVLLDICGSWAAAVFATPRQLCEAFLRVKGLWTPPAPQESVQKP